MRSSERSQKIRLRAMPRASTRTTEAELLSLEPDADMTARAPDHAAFALPFRRRETKREEIRQGGIVVEAQPCSGFREIRHAARKRLARRRDNLRMLLTAGLPRRFSFFSLHPNHRAQRPSVFCASMC